MSRHHILPPIVYTPAPPKPKETRRRRGIGYVLGSGDVDETEEAGEVTNAVPPHGAAAQPQNSLPVEAGERRLHSTTGNLSADTLRTMLEVQESGQAVGDSPTAEKA